MQNPVRHRNEMRAIDRRKEKRRPGMHDARLEDVESTIQWCKLQFTSRFFRSQELDQGHGRVAIEYHGPVPRCFPGGAPKVIVRPHNRPMPFPFTNMGVTAPLPPSELPGLLLAFNVKGNW